MEAAGCPFLWGQKQLGAPFFLVLLPWDLSRCDRSCCWCQGPETSWKHCHPFHPLMLRLSQSWDSGLLMPQEAVVCVLKS